MMWRECVGGAQLRFVDDALVAVGGMLDPVEEVAAFDRQKALDGIGASRYVPLQPVRNQEDRLTDLELVLCHAGPRHIRRGVKAASGLCQQSARRFIAKDLSCEPGRASQQGLWPFLRTAGRCTKCP